MITDIITQIKKIIFFLETFDAAWKDSSMKEIFTFQGKNKIEEIENYENILIPLLIGVKNYNTNLLNDEIKIEGINILKEGSYEDK